MDANIGTDGDFAFYFRYVNSSPAIQHNPQSLLYCDKNALLTRWLSAGVVRSPIFTTVMQVSSRILLVWGIVNVFPSLAGSPGYSSMLIAWSVTEVIRYSYFTLTLSGYSPGILSWLRYNTFFVLYPLGVSSECWLVFSAIAPGKEWRQEFSWALQLILLIYVPGKSLMVLSQVVGVDKFRFLHLIHAHDGAAKKDYTWEEGCQSQLKVCKDFELTSKDVEVV